MKYDEEGTPNRKISNNRILDELSWAPRFTNFQFGYENIFNSDSKNMVGVENFLQAQRCSKMEEAQASEEIIEVSGGGGVVIVP